ncbi:MAG: MerR family DNA-binding transcriptional regulator [Candidatus Pacebacteria bacterium]|nr:MerR family DNA-binding transcriptional regulator [Candidatus Paceibacterota bacterium]
MNNENLISIGEAANRLGVSIDTLRRWDKLGKLKAIRKNNIRCYVKEDIDIFLNNLQAMAFLWASEKNSQEANKEFYCPNSYVFQLRLIKLQESLAKKTTTSTPSFILSSIVGEIGNNSFDHNVGNWPDIPGIFFGYDINKQEIILADRGQGLLKTLKMVRPKLKSHKDAINIAFTEIVSARYPEARGNGLKFVQRMVLKNPIDFIFQSGDYQLEIKKDTKKLEIKKANRHIQGCITIIKYL